MSARVTLPEKEYAGYIFDLDGTLVDSMPTHYKAWRWALKKHGAPHEVFQWEEFVAHGGMAAPDIVADLNATYGLSMEPETVAEEKRNRYAWLLLNETLPVIPETVNLVKRLNEQGIPYAIGTGSMPAGASDTLRSAGIADYNQRASRSYISDCCRVYVSVLACFAAGHDRCCGWYLYHFRSGKISWP